MSHVGPIIFANENAREQLQSEGYVVTFRKGQRTTGETWWRKSRTGEKEGDVEVREIGVVDASDTSRLRPYQNAAGFVSVKLWQDAIRELCGDLPTGYLYEVRKSGGTG